MAKLHLEDCAECSAEVTDLRESLATMRAASRHQAESLRAGEVTKSRSLKFSVPIRIAAMIALIAFAALAMIAVFRWRSSSPGIITGSQPTPVASPQAPALTPSPSTGPNPPKLAENPPNKEPNEQPRNVIALKDGPNEIALDQGGNVVGLSSLPPEMRQAVKHALTGESLNRPDVLDEIASAQVSVRAPTGDEERVRLAYPTNSVIPENQPTLHWIPSKTARAYRVEIADETFHQVARSEDLPATSQSWTSSAPLQRGGIYTWTIRAINKGGEPSSLTSQAKFKVLSEEKVRELNHLKASQSRLAMGLFYAREGMTVEAEREFKILARANPNSSVVKRLRHQIRDWIQERRSFRNR